MTTVRYLIRWVWAEARWLWAVVRWLAESAGYWIRPYDMLADARRWRWQRRQRCGWSYARGGVIRQRTDPSDDSVPFTLDNSYVIPAHLTERYGEDLLRRVTEADHVHRVDGQEETE